ncbi:hypothetical protein T07_4616 [Trichinella nelsoni]|uniref:Uncharacterized protein n=1 Tax=Trichinella nelsoni TaxID=6336 RepID=A0A0V0RZC5_9BILA|nr:hypothetical protein T07_4616 [Trichinella nelsoni]
MGKFFHLTFKIYRDTYDEKKKKYKRGRHEAERRQYEVKQKKTAGAGGYLSGSILLIPTADIRKGESYGGVICLVCDKMGKFFHLTFKIYRDTYDEKKKKYKRGRHEAERRQYEVKQKKTAGAGGYLSGSILLIPTADIRKGEVIL